MNETLGYALGQVALAAKTVEALRPDDESAEMASLRNALEFLDTIYPGPLEGVSAALEDDEQDVD